MSNNEIVVQIERLAQICRKEETNVLIGKYEISLNKGLIDFIFTENEINFRHNLNIKLKYLRQLLAKTPAIKIIGDSGDDSVVQINHFISCVSLQLIRISLKRLIGFELIRPQIKSLNCLKCFDTHVLDDQFWDVFGVWPQLSSLKLSHNNITSVNASVIPSSVQILDLSWNRIQEFNSIANYSVNCISKLDLSYNCLKEVPKLNAFSCLSLQSLFIRGNLIEDINGIEKLVQLNELDVAINCIIDINSIVSTLRSCQTLRKLWIDGNPFACDPNVFAIIEKELYFLTQLNSNIINKKQFINELFNEKPFVLNETQVFKNSDEESELYFDASCDSMDASAKTVDKKGSNKKKALRVVNIKEQTEVSEHLAKLEIKSKDSFHRNNDNSNEAKNLIQKRKDLGDEWLVSMRPSFENTSFLTNYFKNSDNSCEDNDIPSHTTSISSPNTESMPKIDRKVSIESSYTNDDGIDVLEFEERSEWSPKELENDTNIVIVENPDNNETIFVYVREEDGIVFEKCCISGKILRTHDLKVLTNVEIINDLVLKICFDSRIDSKREVKYQFNDINSCLGFNDRFIIPRMRRQVSHEIHYECLKCGQNKVSSVLIIYCPVCGSDAIMKIEDHRKRRSGSDITILSQMNEQNEVDVKTNVSEDNVWEELFSINSCYDNSFFTRVEHSLKLYIEVKLFANSSDDEEVVEGLVKCKAMTGNRLESAFLVISNKNILIVSVDENELYDNFDAYLKNHISKPISSLLQMKAFPNLLTNQGFWLEFRENEKQIETKSRSKSLINRLVSKRSQSSETNSSYYLIVFYDEMIGKSFINYFNEIINKLIKIPVFHNIYQRISIEENSMAINDDLIVMNIIKCAEYKRNDMKSELKLTENIAIIVTEELILLGELYFDANNDYKIKVLYKELIMNLMPEICVNFQLKSFKLSFSDDFIEKHFHITLYTIDSIKKILIPIRSQWEKAFDVSMPLKKC